ncbi:MAG TPA: sensor histidine kinase [Puia sp.]|nr:sensor histidine kinase [Puia sp.]
MHRSRVRYLIEFIIHVLFWSGVYYALKALTTSSFSMMIRLGDKGTQRINTSLLFPYSWIVLVFLMLLFYSNTLWLFKRVIRYKSGLRQVVIISGWFIFFFALNYVVVRLCIGPAGNMRHPLPPPFAPAFGGPRPPDNWLQMQFVMALVFLAVQAVAVAGFFIREWIRNDLTRSQAEAQQLNTEIKFLRSQVNPHFLFNTLNNLFSMAQKKGNDELADGISKLSGMMRYMIYESNTGNVPLFKEIDYLKSCIALNKLRYADSEVAVSFTHPPPAAVEEVRIAPMLFIPFLENAFKHGVSIGHRSYIVLSIAVEQEKLTFTCENADHSNIKKLEDGNTGIGLANVKRRLDLLYSGKYELHTRLDGGKYSVHLQIDLA